MIYWPPRPQFLCGLALAATALMAGAQPANALPIGGNVGVAIQAPSGSGPAIDATAEVNIFGPTLGLRYWQVFGGTGPYIQLGVRQNMSPVPMINVAPGIAGVSYGGSYGGLVTLDASFTPLMLPVSIDATVGAGYINSG